MDIKERVREFIVTRFNIPGTTELPDDASLLERSIVDSKGILDVIDFVEAEFGILVDEQDALPESIDSIAHITAFVQRKKMMS